MKSYEISRPASAFSKDGGPRQRAPRRRADQHLRFVRSLPCVICGKEGDTHAAHLRAPSPSHGKRAVGLGEKPDDSWVTPLCGAHHLFGDDAQHSDQELGFWRKHGIDPFLLALALWRASGDEELGRLIIAEARRD